MDELAAHDFFVLLSDFEGLPLSLVEAMGRGCVPVAARSESGIPELISSGDNGLIMSGRDYDEWARELVEIWEEGRRHAHMSRKARATIRDRFTIERVGAEFDAQLQRVGEEIMSGSYRRPPTLSWKALRRASGDVLPPPTMVDPTTFSWV